MARRKRKSTAPKKALPPKKKTKSKKTKNTFVVFTCKKNNKAIEGLSNDQKNFWKDRIFTQENVVKVAESDARNKIRKSQNVKTNTLSDREKMIANIIANEIGNDVVVKDSNKDNTELDPKVLFEYVKRGFTQKVSIMNKGSGLARVKIEKGSKDKKVESKEPEDLKKKEHATKKKTNSNSKKSGATTNPVKIKLEKLKAFKDRFNFDFRYDCIPIYESFYRGQLEHGPALDERWNMYSMIHNLYESNRLVVYNGSHRVANYGEVHYKSRVVLNFPKEPNMFVLFHGNLVHSGTASKFEDIPFAMNYAPDYRAFAYIDKFGNEVEEEEEGVRKPRGTAVEKRATHEDSVTTTTFKCCDKMKVRNAPCTICDDFSNMFATNEGFSLDLGEAYDAYQSKAKSKSEYLEPIVGDLEKFGWAVYEGIDTRNVVEVGTLFQDLRDLVYRLKIQTGIEWKQIQTPKPALLSRGAGRWQLKISSTHLEQEELESDSVTNEYLKSIVKFYLKLQKEKLSKIEGFQDVKIDEGHLLRNTGCLDEQKEHKDYELIKSG